MQTFFMPLIKGILMKPVCPHCKSSSVDEMTNGTNHTMNEMLLSPTVLISISISLCRSFNVHPAVGVIAGTAIATLFKMSQSNNALPMLINQQYRCEDCIHMFSTIHSFDSI
ncbi:hypothetical protein E5677_00385 [Psychrobacter sp. PAMC27889]|nr:hypothetical protein E5677_00385 [Psychrobacter sp. PAMC27889]